ncbi:hypothetical protein ACH4E7_31630 [Kitasatospora sp. NPDC018058]|uniref:hypothetical protein n=1 Tax=Kitasatospora sp. NPDC018058 TaxID=3364025 RepID=UPI0037BFFC5E
MLSKRLVSTAAICLLLGAGTAACGDDKDKSADKAAAPATTAAAAATPTATPTPTPTVAKLDTDKLTAQEIEKQAKDALANAASLKVAGTMSTEDGAMTIQLAMDRQGQCQGKMGMPGMGSYEIISDGKQYFIKPDAQFWKTFGGPKGEAVAELFKGRYLTGFQDDPKMKSLSELCNLSVASKEMLTDDSSGTPAKGSAGTINGIKTFSLKETDDKGEESLLHVATEGKFYPVRLEKKGGKDAGQIDFTDFDKPFTVQLPSPDNVIDYTKFQDKLKSA